MFLRTTRWCRRFSTGFTTGHVDITNQSDVVILGGGCIGSCVAYFLKSRARQHLSVTVIERDPTYTRSSTVLSAGGIRQQFTNIENIQLSKFTYDFLRNAHEHLSVAEADPVDVSFNPHGYLLLSSKKGLEKLEENVRYQQNAGAKVQLLTQSQLKAEYPFLNCSDVAGGSLGLENEGWFDPWTYLMALKKKNISMGVKYLHAHVAGFEFNQFSDGESAKIETVLLKDHKLSPGLQEHARIRGSVFVNAAGAWSSDIAQMAGIGDSKASILSTSLPVEPRKRFVFVVHAPDGPGINCPFVFDFSGVYFRPEGTLGHFICGRSPTPDNEPEISNLDVDYSFFDEHVHHILAARSPAFEKLRVMNAWAGYYDYNPLDQNGIVGPHPYVQNMIFATGFSGHGLQMSAGIGNAVTELIIDGDFSEIDLSAFSFKRFITNELVHEQNIF